MNKLFLVIILALVFVFKGSSQEEINSYKYIVVPQKFAFLNKADKFQINSLTKFLFNKHGYTAFFEDEDLPLDLRDNRCLGLKANVEKVKGGFLSSKIQIHLIDCDGKTVASSQVGVSKEKEYKVAYNLALRKAFETFKLFNYKYQPDPNILSRQLNDRTENKFNNIKKDEEEQKEIERLKQEIETLKKKEAPEEAVDKKIEMVEVEKTIKPLEPTKKVVKTTTKADLLYAQPTENGFQIIDTEPKKVMMLLYSGLPDTFIVEGEDAIVYKKGEHWIYAENNGKTLKTKVVTIKF
ncbi:hypothetical protein [uncultured Psychroserpens sp.]|uniref:hypothetical protein n=1 Tax=uncultured Psychroserpens sp. TaxID=255436 RepID=UPI00262A5D9D|nr:hypothetical protein [uncultured Psychroserpens sp.]